VLLAVLLALAPAAAPWTPQKPEVQARAAFQKGVEAEQRGELPAALALFTEATELAPANRNYVVRREAARSRLVQQRVDRAERFAVQGLIDEARAELAAALATDPSNSVIQERLQQIAPRVRVLPAPPGASLDQPAALRPAPGLQSFNYRGNSRDAWEAVARAFGLTASVDESVRARDIRFRVDDVDFFDATRALSDATGAFFRPLGPKLFAVFNDTPQNRRQFGQRVVRTVQMPESATPDRMNETMRLVREIAGITLTQLDTRSRTLTLRDSPENVAMAVALLEQLEQGRAEIMLDIQVLEVDRSTARRLGVTPPTSARTVVITPQDIEEAQESAESLLRVIERLFGRLPTTATAGDVSSLIPPLVAFGGGRSVFLATLPGAAVDFSDSLSLVRRGRRMLLRSIDGEPATFFIGERFPINLAVLAPSLVSTPTGPGGTTQSFDRRTLETGDDPVAVVAADFNGDGRIDLAAANQADNSVSIHLALENVEFEERVAFATAAGPVFLAAGEFNGDSILDLVTANQTDNNVTILFGAGDGTFPSRLDIPVGITPRGLVVGDFNGDNRADIAVVNQGDDTVTLLPGNGDGTFGTPVTLSTGSVPRGITAADLNGDNRLDLIIANEGADTISVFLADGSGGFLPRTDFNVGTRPVAVASADFDGDAVRDVVVANLDDDTVTLLIGDGAGGFTTRTDFIAGDGPVALVARDLTGDGNLELAIANENSDDVTVLLGDGAGNFPFRADIGAGDGPSSLAAADINADSRTDLVTANRGANTLTIILNALATPPPLSSLQQPYPGFQYEDLGLKVQATPRIHPQGDVTLQLQIEIRSLGGQSFNGIPVITNRSVEQTVRLRENEPTVISGILQQDQMQGLSGWPGLASAPGAGYLAGRRDHDRRDSELVIIVTPRRVRLGPQAGRVLFAGRDRTGAAPAPAVRQQE